MASYEDVRKKFKPKHIRVLLIAESPPPLPSVQSSRQFYYTDRIRKDDRLFTNTIKAIYSEAAELPEPEIQKQKKVWLNNFMKDGFYTIEALEESQEHEVTKTRRQELIRLSIPRLIDRVKELASSDTKIILIKSNVYEAAAGPLKQAGFKVLNKELVDYPGHYNQRAYREKLAKLLQIE